MRQWQTLDKSTGVVNLQAYRSLLGQRKRRAKYLHGAYRLSKMSLCAATGSDITRMRRSPTGTLSKAWIVGLTPIDRATARLLNMNDSGRVELRLQWMDEGGRL